MPKQTKLKFGDVIINHHASERNPQRVSIVVSIDKNIRCTDGNGKFWNLINDKETNITLLGNIVNYETLAVYKSKHFNG